MDQHDETQNPSVHSEEMTDELSPKTLGKILGKAKRRATLRNVGFSVAAVGILTFAAMIANSMWTSRAVGRLVFSSIAHQLLLQHPDVYMGSYRFSQGALGGNIAIRTYKLIAGTPIPGATATYDYNVFGGLSLPMAGDMSPAPQIATVDGTILYNDQTEQRIMQFYLPGADYTQHFNDLAKLHQIPSQDKVELAISFNRDYSFQAVNAMLPAGIHPSWYWVDTYPAKARLAQDPAPYSSATDNIFGFPRHFIPGDPAATTTSPADFLAILKAGLNGPALWRGQDLQVLKTLGKGSENPKPSDVKISGVVVTGTPGTLQSLQGQPYVRASSLGAIARLY